MSTKSCLNCIHCKAWDIPGTLEDPPEQGWECKHPKVLIEDPEESEDIADCCIFFEPIDYKALAEFEAEMDALIDKAFEDLRASQPD